MNQETADVCSNCGARLTPLVADTPPSDQQASAAEGISPPASEAPGDGDDWLANIRSDAIMGSDAEEDHAAETELPEEAAPNWLGRLREADSGLEEGPPSEAIPDWMDDFLAAGDEDSDEEVPEWLSRVRERREAQTEDQPESGEDEDWITRLRDDTPGEQPASVEGLKPSADEEESIEQPAPRALDLSPPPDVPDPVPQGEILREQAIPSHEAGDSSPALDSIDEDPQPVLGEPIPPEEEMEWFPAPDEGELLDAKGLPHVPALLDEETGEKPVTEISDLNLGSIELPDWLGESEAETPSAVGEEEEKLDLAPATLPSWLEAMRPVDTFRSEIAIESDEVQPVESAGPLAGLRGVLMAEPVVAMPQTASTAASRLEVTERQYAQAELLQRLVEEEEKEIPPVKAERRRLPLMRWAIALILLLAVIIPLGFSQLGVEGYALPSVVSRDLAPLIDLMGTIPTDRPALVVFDYTPGYSGELDTVAGALLEHAVLRSLPIVTISTRPTGPPLAEGLLNKIGAGYGAVNGESYLHLGYLSGGPTAVQLFAIAPRSVVLSGYHLPESLEGSVWDSPLLQGVHRLSDFNLVIVITAGTDTARTWVEQTHPWIGNTPLVMVLSTGAEPLVRPYFEASEPQVDGILSGLPAAVSYRQYSGLPLDTSGQWDAFGLGMLAVELILIAGGAYGVGLWLIRLRER